MTANATQASVSERVMRLLRNGLMPLLLVSELLIFSQLSKQFWTPGNITDLIVNSADLALLAAGMTLVILLAGIDVSVGPMMGVIAWVVATTMSAGMNPWMVVAVALISGVLLGAFNASVIVFGGVAPIIATLGLGAAYQTLLFILWNSRDRFGGPVLPILSSQPVFEIPQLVIPILLIYAALAYVLRMRRFGRHIYAVGNDAVGARLLGVPAGRVTFFTYLLLGALVAVGAMLYVGRVGVIQANSGADMSMAAIAAVVVGGTSILGGQGGVIRTLGGLLFIAVLQKGIVLAGVPSLWSGAMVGAAVALAVAVDVVTNRVITRRQGALG